MIFTQSNGATLNIIREIDEGKQGKVFEAEDSSGSCFAVKMMILKDEALKANIIELTASKKYEALRADKRYCWPIGYGEMDGCFAYLMPLLPTQYIGVEGYINGQQAIMQPDNATNIALELLAAFQNISSRGLTYGDISTNNVLFDPDTGEIKIIDLDNVQAIGNLLFVSGTPSFTSPENWLAGNRSSAEGDMFAFAIYIFTLLVGTNPYDGEALLFDDDVEEQKRLIEEGAFVFSPNTTNPLHSSKASVCNQTWNTLSPKLQQLFTQVFSDSQNISKRPRYVEFRSALLEHLAGLVCCESCKSWFYAQSATCSCGFHNKLAAYSQNISGINYNGFLAANTNKIPGVAFDGKRIQNVSKLPWRLSVKGHVAPILPGESFQFKPPFSIRFNGETILFT
jgi:DNA-binding helix-hairpin-helix protein with protein kinase domain